jgi:hypothetical protein
VFAALANNSTCGLTPAHASVRVYQLHIDEQLTTSSNVDVHIRVAALKILWSLASLLLHIAAVRRLLGSVFKW